MIPSYFVIFGALIDFFTSVDYFVATLKGTVKPNRVSWFLWSLAPLIGFAGELKEGVGIESIMTFTIGFVPLCVLIASFFNKKSEWRLTKFDLFCGTISIAGLLFWYVFQSANVAIAFALIADAFASIPTIVKAYHHPETERPLTYIGGFVLGAITLLALRTYDLAHVGFPFNAVWITVAVLLCLQFRPRKHLR